MKNFLFKKESGNVIANNKADATLEKAKLATKFATSIESEDILEEEYRKKFLQDAICPVRSKKTAYVREEYHEMIMEILSVVYKGKLSLSGYLDHVLTHHFETYRGVLRKMQTEALSKRDCKF